MKKKQFDLEQIQFTQQSDEEKNFSNELIQKYNKQYSVMLSQTKNFFADCKDFLNRFITLNNMGIGFNLPLMLSTIIKMQGEVMSPRKTRKQANDWQFKKEKFENNFIKILQKMGEVVEQLLNFQIKIKTAYLGQALSSPVKVKTRINLTNKNQKKFIAGNYNKQKSNSKSKGKFQIQLKSTHNQFEQQNILRGILQKGMTPFNEQKHTLCSTKNPPIQNLQKLSNKIDKLKLGIEGSRKKQQKIWQIFNQKRPSRNMFQSQTTPQQSEQIKQFKKMNDMLSDIISQKNKYISSYDTVQNSVR